MIETKEIKTEQILIMFRMDNSDKRQYGQKQQYNQKKWEEKETPAVYLDNEFLQLKIGLRES